MEWRYELCPADRYWTERSVLMKTRTRRKNGLSGTDKEVQLSMSITISQSFHRLCLVTGWWSSWSSPFPDKGSWHRFSDTRYAVPPELRSAPVLTPVSIIRSFQLIMNATPISSHDRWRLRVTVAQERGVPWPGFTTLAM